VGDHAVLKTTSKALLRGGLALAGVLVIAVLVRRIGWVGIRANLLLIGPWLPGLVVLNLVTQSGFVLALRSVLEPKPRWRDFGRLYGAYLMGDSANYVVPGVGEAAKVRLLRDLAGGEAALAAVTLHKHADLIAQSAFAMVGVAAALLWFDLPGTVVAAALLGTLLLLILVLLLTWALGRGAFSPILRRLAGWKFLAKRLQRFQRAAEGVDARIVLFHTVNRRRFLDATALCLLGYFGGVLETWVVLRLLAPSSGWSSYLVLGILPMVLSNAVLFVPGKLGGAEAIRTGVAVLIGLSAAQGAAVSLIRRTRELLWVLPGWVLLVREHLRGGERGLVRSTLTKKAIDA
jgi:Lysylphosphatidylglycerol synthase TM region